ncbi:sugar ABC transporter ATP-binding protein [Nitriliruptor alkaliphilus]|uniref:sugar ABC transporter ATP-binding protein n=1 Tax=Nitriliruptor alkaliphilus TaxID=427918 RepID=UPI000698D6DF|nr:sugar ABC transporter ATP-binding protein [Nitriliruptor alkaliphilus]
MTDAPDVVLEVRQVTRSFSGVRALRGVDTAFRRGRVHALLGENGAGKSTLVRVCSGAVEADGGELWLDGGVVRFASPFVAAQEGIAVVNQEPALAEQLSVLKNIFLPRLSLRRPLGRLRSDELRDEGEQLLAELGASIDLDAPVSSLTVAERQLVELAKALATRPRLLFMDEPNSALTSGETERMLGLIGRLREQGVAVVLVTHRLREAFQVADDVTVLRDGQTVLRAPAAETSIDEVIRIMAGDAPLHEHQGPPDLPAGKVALKAEGLTVRGRFADVNLELRESEIVGLAGLVGAGRSDLAETLFGLRKPDAGRLYVNGQAVTWSGPSDAMRAGIALVPEDRKVQALFAGLSIDWNLRAASVAIGRDDRHRIAEAVRKFRVKFDSLRAPISTLSGGNQQKAVIARWMALGPRTLLLDEPTRGIDVAAKAEVHELVRRTAAEGVAILLISSELDEVLDLSHRIIVMRDGRVVTELPANAERSAVVAAAFEESLP